MIVIATARFSISFSRNSSFETVPIIDLVTLISESIFCIMILSLRCIQFNFLPDLKHIAGVIEKLNDKINIAFDVICLRCPGTK